MEKGIFFMNFVHGQSVSKLISFSIILLIIFPDPMFQYTITLTSGHLELLMLDTNTNTEYRYPIPEALQENFKETLNRLITSTLESFLKAY